MCLLVLSEMEAELHYFAHVVRETKFCTRFEDDELRLYKIIEGSTKCCVLLLILKKWCLYQNVSSPRCLPTVLKLSSNLEFLILNLKNTLCARKNIARSRSFRHKRE